MQAYTHVLVGACLDRIVSARTTRPAVRIPTLIALGVCSHVILDDIARATFHPHGVSIFHDAFILGYCTCALGAAVILGWRFRAEWLGITAALIPDLDWVLFRPLSLCGLAPWWQEGWAHDTIRSIPGVAAIHDVLMMHMPDLRNIPLAALPELAAAALVFLLLIMVWQPRAAASR